MFCLFRILLIIILCPVLSFAVPGAPWRGEEELLVQLYGFVPIINL